MLIELFKLWLGIIYNTLASPLICDIYSTNTKGSCSDNFKTEAKKKKTWEII